MLLVKTRIGVSSTHGIGLFANEFISKGTVTWQYHPGFDFSYTEEEIKKLPETPQKALLHYSYFDSEIKKFVIPIDDLRFINHSVEREKINISSEPHADVASRDIQIGEELFCNYNMFDEAYFKRVGVKAEDII